MTTYIGIDPGKKGAIAILSENEPARVFDMPLMPDGTVDARKLFCDIPAAEDDFCILEKAQSMPNQSSSSGFVYGKGYGAILATLQILRIPYMEVRPDIWKKHFSISKKKGGSAILKSASKKIAVAKAMALFPQVPKETFYGPKGGLRDGKAEALLLAEFGKTKRR